MLDDATTTSWRDHLTNDQLYGDIPNISKSIRIHRFTGHCWRSNYELASVRYYGNHSMVNIRVDVKGDHKINK